MTTYRLIWVTDLGYAGMDDKRSYSTPEAAMADADKDVTWKKRGQEWESSVSRYGDQFFVKPSRG